MRAAFSVDLAKAQGAVEAANARADTAERRALLEIDEERQARAKAEKQLEALRGQAAKEGARHREVELEQADALGRLRAQVDAAPESIRELSAGRLQQSAQLDATARELAEARQIAAAAKAVLDAIEAGRATRGDICAWLRRGSGITMESTLDVAIYRLYFERKIFLDLNRRLQDDSVVRPL